MKDEHGLAIIIGEGAPHDMAELNGSEMCNVIHLADNAYPDNKDGDEVETTVKGKLIIEDGMKMLMAKEAGGFPVQSPDKQDQAEGETGNDETPSGSEDQGAPSNDIESAKRNMMSEIRKKGGYANTM